MYRKALTSDSLSTHGFFWAKTSDHPLYVQAVGGGLPRVFVSPHPEPASQTRADKTACVQARAYIVEMVGAPPPLVSDTVG